MYKTRDARAKLLFCIFDVLAAVAIVVAKAPYGVFSHDVTAAMLVGYD